MWYGKGAGRTLEEIMAWKPDYFLWLVETFLDVTPEQAAHWSGLYPGPDFRLPPEVISPPELRPYLHTRGVPEDTYSRLCQVYQAYLTSLENPSLEEKPGPTRTDLFNRIQALVGPENPDSSKLSS